MNNTPLKRWLFLGIMLAITLVLVWKAPPAEQDEALVVNAVQVKREHTLATSVSNQIAFKLNARLSSTATPANLFGIPVIASAEKVIVAKPVIIVPTAPPVPYNFVGKMVENGQTKGFIQQGETLLTVKQGEVLDAQYKVVSIENEGVSILYLPLNTPQTIRAAPHIVQPSTPTDEEIPVE
ncbi:MAG: hypothetical protein HOP21_09270 [Methylotenera sp.]|nr:hypothetical protein [Methylotenera sp.]